MIREAAAAGPVVVVDAGTSLVKPGAGKDDPQRAGKAAVVAAAMRLGQTDAMVLSSTDWTLGKDVVLGLVQEHGLPVLAANFVCDGVAPFPASKVVERGGRRIGVVGVTDGQVPGCTTGPMRSAIEAALAELGTVDVRVLLLPTDNVRTRDLLKEPIAVDLVFDAHPGRIGAEADQPAHGLAIGTGARGQRVGLTSLAWREGGSGWTSERMVEQQQATVTRLETLQQTLTERLTTVEGSSKERIQQQVQKAEADLAAARAALAAATAAAASAHLAATRIVELDTSLVDEPETSSLVKAFLASTQPVGASTDVPRIGTGGAAWAGADACKSCHPAEYAQWLTTPHASAWRSLVDDGHAGDNDCFACHSTGARQLGGPVDAGSVGGLRDVQCESCHGPARQHMSDPGGIRPRLRVEDSTCRGCHDGERDGGRFDPATYRPKILHLPAGGANEVAAPAPL